jgi:hypothetical protein
VNKNAKKETSAIRYLIHHRLKSCTEVEALSAHPDEDTICAFVEGRIAEAGSSRMVSHLIGCGSCRRTAAQLARLDPQIDAETDSSLSHERPGRLRRTLEGLASHLIPDSQEDAVFAYQDPAEEAPGPSGRREEPTSSAEPPSPVNDVEPD